MDTIYALATATGRAGVAIIRISGPAAREAAARLAGPLPDTRKAGLRVLLDSTGHILDEALVLVFDKGASFTGETLCELHVHGSTAVIAAVLRALSAQPDLRLAEPGEFTRRALENDRLDLAQVEGLADLIDAETEAQRKQALRVMRGALSEKAADWRAALLRAIALLEVTIDFVDEDVPVDVTPEVLALLQDCKQGMAAEVAGARASERIRDGFEVAIVGRPNTGKSTLLNRLSGRDIAITSEIAGTTRDVIEVRLDLGGLAVTLLDTAGIRESGDTVESIGIARAIERAEAADLRVFLVARDETPDFGVEQKPGDIVVYGKADLGTGPGLSVSGVTGEGLETLLDRLEQELSARAAGATNTIRERHRVALLGGIAALDMAQVHVRNGDAFTELAAEEMRQALKALDSIIGRVDVENVLDVIFSSFCLGK